MADKLDLVVSRLDDLREDVKTGFETIGDRLTTAESAINEINTKAAEIKGERRMSGRLYGAVSTVVGGAIVAAIDVFFGAHHP